MTFLYSTDLPQLLSDYFVYTCAQKIKLDHRNSLETHFLWIFFIIIKYWFCSTQRIS